MAARGCRASFAAALAFGAIGLTLLTGDAQARTAIDPCNVAFGTDPAGFDGSTTKGLLCARVETFEPSEVRYAGGPGEDADDGNGFIPPDNPLQCPSGSRIAGSQWLNTFEDWIEWDYWADQGYWILWIGTYGTNYPTDQGFIPGYRSLQAKLRNWNGFYEWKTRVFWNCEPISSSSGAARVGGDTTPTGPPPPGFHEAGRQSDDSLRGGRAENSLLGRGGDDRLFGRGGDDHLHSGSGDDMLHAGDHDDLMHARRGADTAVGGDGDDDVLTGGGDDLSHGGNGGDQLFDDQGRDHLRGGPGNDRFWTHDGDRDLVRCGRGEDIALIDRLDRARGCEHAYRSKREAPKRLPEI